MAATTSITAELDVVGKYLDLVQESLGSESIYIRTKETIEDMVSKGMISGTDRANIVAQVLSGMNNAVVAASMQTALQWASSEKEIALKKLEMDKQIDILAQELLLKQKQNEQATIANINAQAERIRMFGNATVIDGVVTSLDSTGKLYNDIELVKQQKLNAVQEENVLKGKIRESQAGVHKLVADTYRNYGSYSYTIGDTGVSGVVPTHGTTKTLSDVQETIAQEQAKGYAWNLWANAATGLSSMVGIALTSGEDIFNSGQPGEVMIQKLNSTLDNMRNVSAPTFA